jgi:signal peptidase I
MENTLILKDQIICDYNKKYKYKIQHGDIILHRSNNGDLLFSRCIGLENDVISIVDDIVYLNNTPLLETYKNLDENNYNDQIKYDFEEIKIEKGKIFVLGDNRYNSRDSRFIGQLPKENVLGKVLYIYNTDNINRIGKKL